MASPVVLAGDQWVPWGFQDMVRKTGDDLMGSVLYYQAATDMVLSHKAVGDNRDAELFAAHAGQIRSSLSELWDSGTGTNEGYGQNRQIDIEGSAYAVFVGASVSQQRRSAPHLIKNYDTLTMKGYMRESPMDWRKAHTSTAGLVPLVQANMTTAPGRLPTVGSPARWPKRNHPLP